MRVSLAALLVTCACGASTSTTEVTAPAPVQPEEEPAPSHRFSGLSLGFNNGCVLEGSTAICWGGFFGSSAEPRVLTQLGDVRGVAIESGMTACGLRADRELYCFGAIDEGARLLRAESLYDELDDLDITAEREAEIQEELSAVEDDTTAVRVAENVRDFVVFEGGGCYLSDELRCWDELAEEEGVVPERTLETEGEIVQLDSSAMHRCLLQADGRVRCWGYGMGLGWTPEGQASNPQKYEEGRQPGLAPARDAVEIATAEEVTCIRRQDGTVACWGLVGAWFSDEHDDEPVAETIEIPGIEDATSIDAGNDHVCAIVGDGRVICWGDNTFGQLGTGDARRVLAPVEVEALSPAREIALAAESTCALVGEEVRCIGSNLGGAFGYADSSAPVLFPERGSRVHTTALRTCVETNDELACTSGAVGRPLNESTEITRRPGRVDQRVGSVSYECTRRGANLECGDGHVSLSGVRQVDVGRRTACAVMTSGRVRCWSVPRLVPDPISSATEPALIDGLDRVESVGIGDGVACVVRNGRVLCWGARAPSIGLAESTTPVELEGVRDVVQVSVHSSSICVRQRNQTVRCRQSGGWSDVEVGNVVQMATMGYKRFLLTSNHEVHEMFYRTNRVALPTEIVDLSTSRSHVCARSRDGRVWCWGNGSHGELGSVPAWVHFTPTLVSLDGPLDGGASD